GVMRSLSSLCKGNFEDYCYYNIMAFPLCFATFLMLIGSKNKIKSLQIISCVILFANMPYYFYRLFFGLIP
ncbi:MAG: DUF2752 domain-containing protein, partial [Treponema sp.]|nr:DUF2752 domain-containing protein [Treponema sp.]